MDTPVGRGRGVLFALAEPHRGPGGQESVLRQRVPRASLLPPPPRGDCSQDSGKPGHSPHALCLRPASNRWQTAGRRPLAKNLVTWLSARDPPAGQPSSATQPGSRSDPIYPWPCLWGSQRKVLLTPKQASSIFYLIFNFYFVLMLFKKWIKQTKFFWELAHQ